MKPITTTLLLLLCLNIQAQDVAKIKEVRNRLASLEGKRLVDQQSNIPDR